MKTEKLAPLVVGSYDMTRLEQVVHLTSTGDKPLSFKWMKAQRTQLLTLNCIHLNSAAAKSLQSVRPHRRQPTRLRRPWDSPGKNTGVGHLNSNVPLFCVTDLLCCYC